MSYRVPSFRYPGGKTKIRKWLVKRMPRSGGCYVEPFVGRANVFWLAAHMLDYREWWLNDPWTARWLEALLRVDIHAMPNRLTKALVETYRKHAVDHRENDDMAVTLEVETMWAGGSDTINPHCAPNLKGLKRRILNARRILQSMGVKITDKEWHRLGLDNLDEKDFVYLDPPYMNIDARYYFDTVEHLPLVKYLCRAPHLWMISGNLTQMYCDHLGMPEWRWKVKRSMFRQKNVLNQISIATECVWTNYTIVDDGSVVRKRLKRRAIRKKRLRKSSAYDV